MDARATLNHLLVDLFNHILTLEELNLKNNGIKISMSEMHILENIRKSESKTMTDVARLQMITLGSMTVAINTLVRKGYVVRTKDANDKRIVRLSLTELAHDALQIHDRFHEEIIDTVVNDLQLDNEATLILALQRVITYFNMQTKLED